MNPNLNKLKHDLYGISLLALGAFFFLALATYSPSDFSWNSLPSQRSVQNACGVVGSFLADFLFQALGLAAWAFPIALVWGAAGYLRREGLTHKNRLLWIVLGIVWLSVVFTSFFPKWHIAAGAIPAGGALGVTLERVLVKAFNAGGLRILLMGLGALWVVIFFQTTVVDLGRGPARKLFATWELLHRLARRIPWSALVPERTPKSLLKEGSASSLAGPQKLKLKAQPQEEEGEDLDVKTAEVGVTQKVVEAKKPVLAVEAPKPAPKKTKAAPVKREKQVAQWSLPDLNLIENPPIMRVRIEEKEIHRKADLLKEKLSHFSVRGEVVAARPGPAVTLFEFRPEADVKLSKITDLEDDLSLALSSESLRILAPIPGRDVVGVETSNSQREMVYLKDLLEEKEFWKEDIRLPVCLGKQVNGDPKIVDLRKMPHLMVAGTTGSGKSVFTVSTIIGLIFRHSPQTLRLLLIDPKQVDLTPFERTPHLVTPIVTDSRAAVGALKWAVREMEKRYRSMAEFGARGLEDYNKAVANLSAEELKMHDERNNELEQTPGKKAEMYYCRPLPYMVIVVEEFADLMTVDKANVETSVVRLAQKARACGIHLVLCLQSPRREVVTGLIKSNIPGRIAFKAASVLESRLILDESGAERLLAQGDMLFRGPGSSAVIRHHGPYLKDGDIASVTEFWGNQAPPDYEFQLEDLEAAATGADTDGAGDGGEESFDEKYDEILAWASTQKEVSASLIQRRFQLGYPRAARLIETFEKQGVVGPANGSKPRQVLVNNLKEL